MKKIFCLFLFAVILCGHSYGSFSQIGIHSFTNAFLHLRNDILKVKQYQDYVNKNVKYKTVSINPSHLIRNLSRMINKKFEERIDAVKQLHQVVEKAYLEDKQLGSLTNCCLLEDEMMTYNSNYGAKVDLQSFCSVAAAGAIETHEVLNAAFLKVAQENLAKHPGLKWQYFGSDGGVLTQYPATKFCVSDSGNSSSDEAGGYDNRFRPWYVQASAPLPKDVVLVIDRSASMSKFDRMKATKQAAITVLNTLTPDDRVAVVTFSDEAYALGTQASEIAVSSKKFKIKLSNEPSNTSCFNTTMASAIPSNIDHLTRIIRKVIPSGETYYAKALKISFNFLQTAFNEDRQRNPTVKGIDISEMRERVILFLSDGEPSDLPYKIFKFIHDRNKQMYNSVVLLCFALGKSTFGAALQKMASQNFTFVNEASTLDISCQDKCDLPKPPKGIFKHVRETKSLRSVMGFYYNFFFSHKKDSALKSERDIVWSVPYFDVGGLGMVTTAATAVIVQDQLVGVVGVDLSLHELLADATYFRAAGEAAFVFLLDLTGRVVMHPLLPNPIAVTDKPIITDIAAFERSKEVQQFLKTTLLSISTENGAKTYLKDAKIFESTFDTVRVHPTVHKGVLMYKSISTYSCAAVSLTNLVLCLVVERDLHSVSMLADQSVPESFDFLYHKFTENSAALLCWREDQLICPISSVVMLSPSAFIDSGRYATTEETTENLNMYHQYMLLGNYPNGTNAVFKDDVRSAVLASWPLENMWKNANDSKSVVWRYFGSEQGIFRIYPGVEMPKFYYPATRPWYETASALLWEYYSQHVSSVSRESGLNGAAISPPYLDANGAGLVLTLSSAVLIPNDIQNSDDHTHKIFGVMGADILLIDFEQLLTTAFPQCARNSSLSCIAMDTSGYVICDKYLIEKEKSAVALASSSNYHIVHAHPGMANALIREKILIHHKCVDVSTASYKSSPDERPTRETGCRE